MTLHGVATGWPITVQLKFTFTRPMNSSWANQACHQLTPPGRDYFVPSHCDLLCTVRGDFHVSSTQYMAVGGTIETLFSPSGGILLHHGIHWHWCTVSFISYGGWLKTCNTISIFFSGLPTELLLWIFEIYQFKFNYNDFVLIFLSSFILISLVCVLERTF